MSKKLSPQQHTTSPQRDLPQDEHALRGYTPIKTLGHGSQGDVFLAKRDSDGTEVAIKRLNIESVKTWKTYELFHREAEVLSTLDIDGIAKFYEAVDMPEDDPPRAYIVQEFIPGTTLGALIGQGHRFSLGSTFDIIVQLLTLLKQLHGHTPPVIHRDIKPNNIMLRPQANDRYKVYLLDFGAVANPQLQGGGSTVAGTYGFMPPEQLMGKPLPASDVYAVAAVAVNLITGVSPADMPVKDFHLIFEPQMQFMPVNVVNLLRQMLEPNTENRLCDYDYLIESFKNFRGGNYDTANEIAQHNSNAEYETKLREVESYIQPGNIELWQRLPDITPRDLPQIYQEQLDAAEKRIAKKKSNSDNNLYFGKNSNIYFEQYEKNKAFYDKKFEVHQKGSNEFGPGDVITIGCSFIMTVLFIVLLVKLNTDNIVFFIVLFFVSVVVIPMLIIYLITKFIATRRSLQYEGFSQFKGEDIAIKKIRSLLKSGRKTIATIVSIQYEPVHEDRYEQHVETNQCVVHQSPRFKVQYRFNPPDDMDANDLIHEITLNEPPESFLKEGDPLPILYRIYRDINGDEHVDSMPFPIVVRNIESFLQLRGKSIYHA